MRVEFGLVLACDDVLIPTVDILARVSVDLVDPYLYLHLGMRKKQTRPEKSIAECKQLVLAGLLA